MIDCHRISNSSLPGVLLNGNSVEWILNGHYHKYAKHPGTHEITERLQMQYTICDIIHLHKIGKLTQAFYINNAYNYDLDGADHIEINIEGKSSSLLSK